MLIFSQLQQSHRILLFNSQSLKETDQYCVYYGITKKAFQHSRRLAIMPQVRFLPSWYFNSQPHKEADAGMQVVKASRLYFNSQPHKEADFFRFQFLSQHSISTHSLTRRLTFFNFLININFNISTHSLTRRLTEMTTEEAMEIAISTHSLTRRLTYCPLPCPMP